MKIIGVLLLATWLTTSALAQSSSPALNLFQQALNFVNTQYFGPSSLDVATLGARYQNQLLLACASFGDNCAYDKAEPIIQAMLAELEDNHAYYLSPADVQARAATATGQNNSPVPILGITRRPFLDAENKLISYDTLIVNVLPGSPAEIGGLQYGDRWIGYDGLVFSEIKSDDEYSKALQTFTARVRSTEPLTMTVLRGTTRERLILRLRGAIFNTAQLPSLTIRPDNVAVLRIKTFLVGGIGQKVHDLLRQLANSTIAGLILDMRGNGGGFANERWLTAGALIQNLEPQRRIPRYNAENNAFEESYTDGQYLVKNLTGQILQKQQLTSYTRFDGAMVVLVDGGCASACEFLSSSFMRAKRATIIGEATVGIGSTNTQGFNLVNGGQVSLPTLRSFWTDSTPLPSRITPDLLTPNYELELFSSGRDITIEQALQQFGLKTDAKLSLPEQRSHSGTPIAL